MNNYGLGGQYEFHIDHGVSVCLFKVLFVVNLLYTDLGKEWISFLSVLDPKDCTEEPATNASASSLLSAYIYIYKLSQ